MDWRTEISRIVQLLDRGSFAELKAGILEADADIVASIERHNARVDRCAVRVRQLVEARGRFFDFAAWQIRDSAELMAERDQMQREVWDTLRDLQCLLQERQAALDRMLQRVQERYRTRDQEYDDARAAAERRMAGQRRAYVKANPACGEYHFQGLVSDDESVEQAGSQVNLVRGARDDISHARYCLVGDMSAVTARQRDAFAALVA